MIPPGDARFGINEGFAAAGFARQLGARWTRWVVEWSEVQRTPNPEEFNLFYIDPETLRQELRHGYKMMAVLKSTPPWAQTNPAVGVRAVPAGLDLPADDPGNTWGAFVKDIARRYAGGSTPGPSGTRWRSRRRGRTPFTTPGPARSTSTTAC